MNKVILIGRLTKDPEVKSTASQVSFCNFTIACDRKFKDANGQRQADFISCVAWRQTATFVGSYFHKGSKIAVTGSIQTRTYDDNSGQKRYVTEVVVEDAEFVESANNTGRAASVAPEAPQQAPAESVPSASVAPKMDASVFDSSDDGVSLPFEI